MLIRVFGSLAAMLAAGGSVMAGLTGSTPPFSVDLVALGGPSGLGTSIAVTGGTIFQHPLGTNFPPSPELFGDFPSLQYDSYVALDPNGPAAIGTPSAAPDGSDGLDFSSTALVGDWFSDAGVLAEVGPFPGFFAVFIARISVTEGSVLSAVSIGAIVESEFGVEAIEQDLNQGTSEEPPNRGGGAAYDFRSTRGRVTFPDPFNSDLASADRGINEITVDFIDIYLVRIPTPGAAIITRIDIRPGGCPNPLNRASPGVLTVNLVGSPELDVSAVDVATLRLSRADGAGGEVVPLLGPPQPGIEIDDVSTPFEGELCDCHALGPDGILDVVMKFDIQQLRATLELDGVPPGAQTELTLRGQMLDGTSFVASDCAVIVPMGDANFDGSIDFADIPTVLGNWLIDYGAGTGPGDANGDGVVSFADITSVLGNWLAVSQ